jgi:class 3 adenylate cyclase/tetratricopeptide (TPR) repeat protein
MAVCASCGFASVSAFRFCPECGAPARLAEGSGEKRKVVTVLFCDVTGSTALGESTDPEVLRALLARYFERMRGIVESHGGTVEKFIGDAVMAVFGVPVAHEDDALRACRAAVEMRDALPELGIGGRIGVNTGEVVTGTSERLATGDAVNVAARLEQAAGPGEVLIGEATHAVVREAVVTERVESLSLKGKSEPVPAHRLVSVLEAPERGDLMRFVGRENELGQIVQAWDRAEAQASCELVTVVGEAGVGKSRLVAEALAAVEPRVVRGHCLSYGEGITYWPVVEVVKQLGVLPSDETAAAALRSLLGESDRPTGADEIAWAFRKLLEEQAPLVVLFDDIQWGERTFLDLVESTALLSTGAPLLLLCMARPELLEQRPLWPAPLVLEPLAPLEAEALIGDSLPADLRRRIAERAGGNPLFITEMLALTADGHALEVPPTLRALLTARLDQLDEPERRVLERGSVEGELFHRGAVGTLTQDEPEVLPRLAALVRHGLIRPDRPQIPGEDAFRFRHLLVRDAAYDALPKAVRADLHRRFADWLEGKLVDPDELLGYHLEQAARYRTELGRNDDETRALVESAAGRLTVAGLRASARGDLAGAASLLGRAAALLPNESRERIDVVLALVEPLAALMQTAQLEQLLEQSASAADLLGDELLTARVNVERAWIVVHTTAEQWSDSELLAQVDEAIAVFERHGDDVAVARALEVVSQIHLYHGRLSEVAAASERGYRHAERAHHVKLQGKHRLGREVADQWGATPLDRIDELLEDDCAWARRTGSLGVEACATVRLGVTRSLRGDRAGGNELFDRGMSACTALGTRIWAYQELGCWVWALTDDPDVAEPRLRETRDVLAEAGKRGMVATIASILGECLYRQGRYDEAADLLEEAAELGAEDDVVTQAHVLAGRAKLSARRGELDEAEVAAREGVALAGATEFVDLRADSLLALAEVLRLAGRKDEAADATRQALAIWEAKANVVHTERARALLAQLGTCAAVDGGRET